MKLIAKKTNYGYPMIFKAGFDGQKRSMLEIVNEGSPMGVVHGQRITSLGRESITLTFESESQRKALAEGLRFMADVLDGEYNDISVIMKEF